MKLNGCASVEVDVHVLEEDADWTDLDSSAMAASVAGIEAAKGEKFVEYDVARTKLSSRTTFQQI